MEDIDYKQMWREQNEKIEKSLQINKTLLRESLQNKTMGTLKPMISTRWLGIVFGILWCVGIAFIVWTSWSKTNIFFKASLIVHLVVSAFAVGLYIYHLVLLNNCDISEDVIGSQEKLIKLEESNLLTFRLSLLQLPVFSTWFITYDWIQNSPMTFWGILMPLELIQALIGIWFFRNLRYKNHDKNWFKWFMGKGEFATIKKSMGLLHEIENINK